MQIEVEVEVYLRVKPSVEQKFSTASTKSIEGTDETSHPAPRLS